MGAYTTVYLTRHGLSEHNLRTNVYMGRAPHSRLTDTGREQARRLGDRLQRRGGVEAIVASSLPRTLETAELIAAALGAAAPLHTDERLWELSKGEWEGRMPVDGVPEGDQAALRLDPFGYRYPGGESYADVTRRAGAALDDWLGRLAGQRVLVVAHGDVLRALLHHTMGTPPARIHDFAVTPCALSELQAGEGHWRLICWNDTSHQEETG